MHRYVDSTVLRDEIERHGVRQPQALQWLVRQLLSHGGGSFSFNRLHGALRSQALAEPIGVGALARVIALDRRPPAGECPVDVGWSSALELLLEG